MKSLIDNALPPRFAELLRQAGHDTVHVRVYGMEASADRKSSRSAQVLSSMVVLVAGSKPKLVQEPADTIPRGWKFDRVSAVATDSANNVYVFQRGKHGKSSVSALI